MSGGGASEPVCDVCNPSLRTVSVPEEAVVENCVWVFPHHLEALEGQVDRAAVIARPAQHQVLGRLVPAALERLSHVEQEISADRAGRSRAVVAEPGRHVRDGISVDLQSGFRSSRSRPARPPCRRFRAPPCRGRISAMLVATVPAFCRYSLPAWNLTCCHDVNGRWREPSG
jgi:hypothetical protein